MASQRRFYVVKRFEACSGGRLTVWVVRDREQPIVEYPTYDRAEAFSIRSRWEVLERRRSMYVEPGAFAWLAIRRVSRAPLRLVS